MKTIETRRRLQDAAFKLFAQKGTAFSLAEAAAAVGIQKPSIYAHFSGKEDLLFETINREIDAYFSEINNSGRDLHRLYHGMIAYYKAEEYRLFFWKRLLLFPPKALDDGLQKKIQERLQERFDMVVGIVDQDMLRGVLRSQNPAVVAVGFFSLIHGLLSVGVIFGTHKESFDYETAWQNFLDGVKA